MCRKTEKERQLATGRVGGDDVGAKSYNGKKALSSKNHSILSDPPPQYVSGVHKGERVLQDNLYVDVDQIRK
jgi:hypothetical protein